MGTFAALRILGLELRVLMVFAGGVGIGTGIGLQQIVSDLISGFIIIFGRKLRKGDWIKVGDTLGMVSHIYLRATKIWTRDNIEYIVPNSDLISKPIVNYTLTSPVVRIYIPIGVSYDADPVQVKDILLKCAGKQQGVLSQFRKPEARIAGFGDSAINFELLVWIDIGQIAVNDVKSRLYFTMIEELGAADIGIPYPQHEVRLRSGAMSLPAPEAVKRDTVMHRQVGSLEFQPLVSTSMSIKSDHRTRKRGGFQRNGGPDGPDNGRHAPLSLQREFGIQQDSGDDQSPEQGFPSSYASRTILDIFHTYGYDSENSA